MGAVAAAAGVATTILGINETKKANKEQKRQNALLNQQIASEKAEALKKRKQLIDEQRYNLLGSSDNSESYSNNGSTSSSGYSLLDNETLG